MPAGWVSGKRSPLGLRKSPRCEPTRRGEGVSSLPVRTLMALHRGSSLTNPFNFNDLLIPNTAMLGVRCKLQ